MGERGYFKGFEKPAEAFGGPRKMSEFLVSFLKKDIFMQFIEGISRGLT